MFGGGENTLCNDMNLSIACKNMLTPSARRNTPLKKAPSSRDRCQPKDRSLGESFFAEIYFCSARLLKDGLGFLP